MPLSTMTVAIPLLLLPVFIDLSATEADGSPIVPEPHAPDQVPLAGRSAIRLQTYARFMIDISSLARQEGRSDDQLATDYILTRHFDGELRTYLAIAKDRAFTAHEPDALRVLELAIGISQRWMRAVRAAGMSSDAEVARREDLLRRYRQHMQGLRRGERSLNEF